MNSINAVLVDDEYKLLELLKMKLEATCPHVKIIGTATNADDGFKLISDLKPDLVFLDINMPNGSGFDLLRKFNKINFEVIFVTGHSEYSLEAIKFCAIGYVLKPIINQELIDAVDHATERAKSKITQDKYAYFLNQLKNSKSGNNRLGIQTEIGLEFVKANDIIRCQMIDRISHIHLKDGSKIISSYQLSNLSKILEPYNFFFSHKSHLINLDHILKYDKDGVLIMTDGGMVPLARRKKSEFLDIIERLR